MKNMFDDKVKEECAVFGVSGVNEAFGIVYNALLALQHRGQEGSGIATIIDENDIVCEKGCGLVSEIFNNEVLQKFSKSNVAIGHNRYSTTGNNSLANVQPFVTEYLLGRCATCHNGNILNAKELKLKLQKLGARFEATSDSEVISTLIAYHIVKSGDLIEGIKRAVGEIQGAFSLLILTSDGKIVAVRDVNGFRPLAIGKNEKGICIASESCAFDSCGFDFLRNVKPGEIVVVENGEIVDSQKFQGRSIKDSGICIFEYVYFARPDSVIDGLSVYEARFNMGRILAKEAFVDADVVCGVPDSGLEAASGFSFESGIPLVTGFVKNRYVGRSFIYPSQVQREGAVKVKLNALSVNIKDKRVVLVDDSIVRGTTSGRIITLLKNAGAKEVHLRISAPPFKFSCHFGTDIDSEENLIANKFEIEEIRKKIGADSLSFISLDGLKESCNKCELEFCTQCFSGSNIKLRKDEFEK